MKQAAAATPSGSSMRRSGCTRKPFAFNPPWIEGYWYLGVINYELDRYRAARNAFRRVSELQPENAAAWILKGLCEFQLKNYEVGAERPAARTTVRASAGTRRSSVSRAITWPCC